MLGKWLLWFACSNDGIDIDSSQNVTLTNSSINTGDDGICIKSSAGNNQVAYVTVSNVTVRSRSSAVKLGSNIVTDAHDLLFEDIIVNDSNRGLALQVRGGGNVYNLMFRRVVINGTRFW